jgi:hypothetical protein
VPSRRGDGGLYNILEIKEFLFKSELRKFSETGLSEKFEIL